MNILLVDDHSIVVEGCASLLRQAGYEAITVITDCESAMQHIMEHKPDLLVVDISMPGMGGLGLIRRIQKKDLHTRIIVFSMHDDPSIIYRTIDAGVKGYISKTSSPYKIVEAVKVVMTDNIYLSQDVAQALALDKFSPAKNALKSLSPKEYEIFDMLVNGNAIKDIATTLYLSPKSVSNYVSKIKAKLDVSSTVELVHLGYKHKITHSETDLSN